MGQFTSREAPDIDDRPDLIGKEDLDEILRTSQPCTERIDRSALHVRQLKDIYDDLFQIFRERPFAPGKEIILIQYITVSIHEELSETPFHDKNRHPVTSFVSFP